MLKYLGKHYGTERFFVCIFLTFTMFVSAIVWGGQVKKHNNIQTVSSTPIYNTKTTWSLTNGICKIVGLYSSEDRTKVFLMIQNEGSESVDAGDYQLFMKGRDEQFQNKPALTIYAFGNSGYIGFLFTDAKGFANQVADVTIRQKNYGSNSNNDNVTQGIKEGDVSFYNHNQIRLYLNFGATGIEYSDILNASSVDPVKMYAQVAFGTKYKTLTQDSAQTLLDNMQAELSTVKQDRQKLTTMGLQVPNLPYYMENDIIDTIGITDNDAIYFTEAMIKTDESEGDATVILGLENTVNNDSETVDYSKVEDKKQAYIELDDKGTKKYMYFLHTDYLFPGYANVDWQHHEVYDEFVTQISEDMTYSKYSADRDAYIAKYDTEPLVYMPTSIKYAEWRMANGEYFDKNSKATHDMQIAVTIEEYETTISNYLKSKKKYCETIDELINLEYDIRFVENYTTIRNCKVAEQSGYLVY